MVGVRHMHSYSQPQELTHSASCSSHSCTCPAACICPQSSQTPWGENVCVRVRACVPTGTRTPRPSVVSFTQTMVTYGVMTTVRGGSAPHTRCSFRHQSTDRTLGAYVHTHTQTHTCLFSMQSLQKLGVCTQTRAEEQGTQERILCLYTMNRTLHCHAPMCRHISVCSRPCVLCTHIYTRARPRTYTHIFVLG